MNHKFTRTILRWTLGFVLFYLAFWDLREANFFPQFLDFYLIFLGAWLFVGKKIKWSAYLVFITFSLISVYKIFVLDFSSSFMEIGYALVSLALIGLVRE